MANVKFTKEGLPIISLQKFLEGDANERQSVVKSVVDACQTVGCFFVADHGVEWNTVEDFFKLMNQFFKLPKSEKEKYETKTVKNRGYAPFESQNVNAFMGRFGYPNDPVEKYVFGPMKPCPIEDDKIAKFKVLWAPNIFPERPDLKENVAKYYSAVTILAEHLMQIFSVALSMPEDYIYNYCSESAHWLKVNFYPKVDEQKANQDRFPEHTDSTPFTIVCLDQSPNSLLVRNVNGEWVFANGPEKTFFVNLGDIMALWTNDKWVATPHKVVFPPKEHMYDRTSLVFFIQMNHDAALRCMPSCLNEDGSSKYETTSFEEYTNSKLKRLANANIY